MTAFRVVAQLLSGLYFVRALIKTGAHRHPTGQHTLRADQQVVVHNALVGHEKQVRVDALRAGAAGVIRGDKAAFDLQRGVLLPQLRDHDGGEHMGADHGVDVVLDNVPAQGLCPLADEAVGQGAVVQPAGVVFRETVAQPEKPGHIPVHAHMPPGDEAGGAFGDKAQRVLNAAAVAVPLKALLYGPGAGIVAFAGVAAQNQRVHFSFSFPAQRRSSRTNLGRLYR